MKTPKTIMGDFFRQDFDFKDPWAKNKIIEIIISELEGQKVKNLPTSGSTEYKDILIVCEHINDYIDQRINKWRKLL